jgi:hypothetical protein
MANFDPVSVPSFEPERSHIMKKLIMTAFIAGAGGLALVSSVQAMPIAPLDKLEVGAVVKVFGGLRLGPPSGAFWRMPSALQLSAGVAYRTLGPRLQTESVDDQPEFAKA